ncbi:DNA starvation/stationary phase protection protein Dps [Halobacteriales archaeon Cl-PHB]
MSHSQPLPRPDAEQPSQTTQGQPGATQRTGGWQMTQQGGGQAGVSTTARTFPTANDIQPETRGAVVQRLNETLADTTDLMTQAKFAHWNVKGINFYQLHLLFDDLHEVFEAHADVLAERATALGGQAMGTARLAATRSSIPELTPDLVTGPDYLQALSAHVALHATNLRAAIEFAASYGDEDTADLFTELSREVDQQLYFLESHLQTSFEGTVTHLQGEGAAGATGGQPAGGVASQTAQAGSQSATGQRR